MTTAGKRESGEAGRVQQTSRESSGTTTPPILVLVNPQQKVGLFLENRALVGLNWLLLGVCVWLAAVLWQPMSRATLAVAFAMLHPFVPTVTADAETIELGTREFSVLVSRACSGP